jgi:CDP-glucose 4,6-dehydratase
VQFPGAPTVAAVSTAFNFGPLLEANRSVAALVTELLCHWPGHWYDASTSTAVHEAGRLNLAIDKAFHTLQWRPVWGFTQSVAVTARWYVAVAVEAQDALQQTRDDILTYMVDARQAQLRWAAEVLAT